MNAGEDPASPGDDVSGMFAVIGAMAMLLGASVAGVGALLAALAWATGQTEAVAPRLMLAVTLGGPPFIIGGALAALARRGSGRKRR